jgi:hypothetical protein
MMVPDLRPSMHRLAPLLLVLAVLAAGCAGPAHPTTSTSSDGPTTTSGPHLPAGATLVSPKALTPVHLGPGAGEPNIAVAPDGTVYVTPIDHLYRSRDGGKSFTDLGTTKTDGHGDGDIAVDAQGRLHWLGLFGKGGAIPYQASDDGGDHFGKATDLSEPNGKPTGGTGSDREWIDATPDGWLYAAWRDSDKGGIIAFRASHDNGTTWLPRVTVSPDTLTGPIVHGPRAGEAYIPLTVYEGTGPSAPVVGSAASSFRIALASTLDHGATWTVRPVVTPRQPATMTPVADEGTGIFPVAAVDANGTLYVAWASPQPTGEASAPRSVSRFGIYLTVSHDGGAQWSEPLLLSDPAHAALLPWIVAGDAGRLVLTWYENTVGNPSDSLPDLWNVKLWESIDADRGTPHSATVQLNTDPSHIGSACTVGGACLFTAGDRSLLDYFEIALQPDGLPIVVWAASAAGTAVGVAAQSTQVWVGGLASGSPLVAPAT